MTLPDPARYAMDAAAAIGADYADLDKGGGYLFRVSKGGKSIVCGAGGVASFPINNATAFTLSRDKAHTKTVLKEAGIGVIEGGLFFAHTRRAGLRGPGREAIDALGYAGRLGYPVFVKPNHGARGNFAEVIDNQDDLSDYIGRVAVEYESFLIEPVVRGVEHRVLVHDGRAVFHSTKDGPYLVGDGRTELGGLLARLNAALALQGVSPYQQAVLQLAGHDALYVPADGERVDLPGRRNLSAAGGVERVTADVPAALADIATRAVGAVGLRIGAVDMFDLSAASDLSGLRVIEVNGNPGLKTLELAGRMDLIRAIWTSMLSEALG